MRRLPGMMSGLAIVAIVGWGGPAASAQARVAFARPGSSAGSEQPSSQLDRLARFHVENTPIVEALRELRNRSGVILVFSPDRLPERHMVSCACDTVSVRVALQLMLADVPVRYSEVGDQVLIEPTRPVQGISPLAAPEDGLSSAPADSTRVSPLHDVLTSAPLAQDKVVAGTIVENRSLNPLAGARISVQGTTQGAISDGSGRFRLTGLSGTEVTLTVVMIGYRPTTRAVRVGETDVRIALTEAAINLDEVVVTGTPAGVTERRALGNSISRIDVKDQVTVAPAQGLDQFLNSKAPGVVLQPGAGDAGTGSQIRIRGLSSLSGRNGPLIYVDGVRVESTPGSRAIGGATGGPWNVGRLNDIDLNEIESMEIIKGPAAATLYGTEASNGVIQIITKKGIKGASRISFTSEQGASWLANPEGVFPSSYVPAPGGGILGYNFVQSQTDRGDPVFRTGHNDRYGVDINGGGDAIQYFVSGSLDREEGVLRPNATRRFNGRLNLNTRLSDKLNVVASAGYVNSFIHPGYNSGGGVKMNCAVRPNPLTKDTETRGCFAPPDSYEQIFDRTQTADRTTLSFTANYQPFPWFSNRLIVGADQVSEVNLGVVEQFDGPLVAYYGTGTSQGFNTTTTTTTVNRTFDYSGTASAHLGKSVESKTSIGAQYFQNKLDIVNATGVGFPAPGIRSISSAAQKFASQLQAYNSTVGFYVQQQIGWKKRLFLTAAARADDNSAFGENFDVVVYPKFSGTWVMSEEPFWSRHLGFFNDLRLRMAYGQSGQQPQAFAALQSYQPFTGPGDRPTVRPQFYGNPDLGPEKGAEVEVGFDAGLFNDRLGIEFTYYNKTTNDAILNRTIAPSLGFPGQQFVNIGQIRNKGIELSVNATPVQSRNVTWQVGFNLATNDNKITDLGGLPSIALGLRQEHREGYPVAAWFEKKVVSADVDASGRTTNLLCDGGTGFGGAMPGGAQVSCATAPRLYAGQTIPRKSGSLTSTVTLFKRLTLYGMLDFKLDYNLFDANTFIQCEQVNLCLENFDVATVRKDPLRAAEFQNGIWRLVFSDAGFYKLRQLSATYQVPDRLARHLGASAATVTISGRNLHTWTNWASLREPEVRDISETTYGGSGLQVQQQGNVPQPREFIVGIRLTF